MISPGKKSRLKPAKTLVTGFLLLILTGSLLLSLPMAARSGEGTSFLDALFTATSAVCVTGLTVLDTGTHWSLFGQGVVLFLIQVGGLGFMTFGILFAILLGRKIGLRSRLLLQQSLSEFTLQGVVKLALRILGLTILVELVFTLLLAIRFIPWMGPARGLWFSVFHVVSAFNNAGFDIFGSVHGPFSSLSAFTDDPLVLLSLASLFIMGGLGFTVVIDMIRKRDLRHLVLHTKLVLFTTAFLIVAGTLLVFLLERNNPQTLGGMPLSIGILNAFFHAVTPRTAGFSALNMSTMTGSTQLVIIILMFIGGSPGSTAGGIKTTTFATLVQGVRVAISGRKDVVMFHRKIPESQVSKVLLILMLAICLVFLSTFLLTITEQAEFLALFFEVVSAFGTVGLSMGITTELSTVGRLILVATMFLGRLGPATVAFALARERTRSDIGYPEEKIILG